MVKITPELRAKLNKSKGALKKNAKALRGPSSNRATLRKSITPGTVLILLAGPHQGKRVVFLKQMEKSGLLLVTGPYKLNRVPITRVDQKFVIATSTKVSVPESVFAAVSGVNDAYFSDLNKVVSKDKKKFFESAQELKNKQVKINEETHKQCMDLQKKVDAGLLESVKSMGKVFAKYVSTKFSIQAGQYPHLLKF